jgi:hypothetical protein
MSIFETSGAPRKGTNAQVVEYWRETYPAAMSRAFPRARQAASAELFPHLPTSVRLFPVEGKKPVPIPSPAHPHQRERGLFVDPAQQARAACSPLGGKIW